LNRRTPWRPAPQPCRIGAFDVRTWLALTAVGLLCTAGATTLAAQDSSIPDLPPPFTLAYVDGHSDIARPDGVQPAQAPDVLDAGDRLRIADGRAELVSAEGALVHVDRDADVQIGDDGRLRLTRGRLLIRTPANASALDVMTPVGMVRLEHGGEYQLTARDLDGDVTIAAVRGHAALALASGDVPVAASDEVSIDPRGMQPRRARLALRPDAFTDWADRRVADMQQALGAQPLPAELTAYAPAFAAHGRWDTLPVHGAVWFPATAPGWRPYAHGSWRHTRYGWTWIDSDPWGWPVHHYGRWGRHERRGWYWIPRRTWGPAWVGWALDANYVGWAPLGWDSRPVVDFFAGARVGPIDVWAGSWSMVPRGVFGRRGPVRGYYTDLRRLPGPVLGGFVVQNRAPRHPAGWERRLPAARGYGRPTPMWRGRRADRTPGLDRALPRGDTPARAASDPIPRPEAILPPVRDPDRDPRAWGRPTPQADDARRWRVPDGDNRRAGAGAPRPGDARGDEARRGAERPAEPGDAGRAVPRSGDGGYGRPAPVEGRSWGRPEATPSRASPNGAARERRGSQGGREASGGGANSGSGSAGGGASGGNRRRQR
jgi:uncharacterized membrane protein YgcG